MNVGLRTSDLAIKVAKATTSAINGVVAIGPSTTFIAQDFYGVEATNALRFLSKHDGYSTRGDRFGNLHYQHNRRFGKEHLLTQSMVTGGSRKDVNENIPNRVVVRGRPRANNDENVVQVDDLGMQVNSVNEVPGGIYAPTAVTKSSARLVGKRMLALAKQSVGSEKLNRVVHASHIHPGDAVSYLTQSGSERKVVLASRHELTGRTSELHINAVEASLEDVIQRFQEVDISSSAGTNNERNRQFTVEEFSTSFGFKVKVSWRIEERPLENRQGGLVVGVTGRDIIAGNSTFQSTGVLINNGGGYPVGTTIFTVDGIDATTQFSVGDLVYRGNGNLLGEVSAVVALQVTIGTGSPDLVEDDEELLLLSPNSFPEAKNAHLKLGLNKRKFRSRRRG